MKQYNYFWKNNLKSMWICMGIASMGFLDTFAHWQSICVMHTPNPLNTISHFSQIVYFSSLIRSYILPIDFLKSDINFNDFIFNILTTLHHNIEYSHVTLPLNHQKIISTNKPKQLIDYFSNKVNPLYL